jgi:hypothetical protein
MIFKNYMTKKQRCNGTATGHTGSTEQYAKVETVSRQRKKQTSVFRFSFAENKLPFSVFHLQKTNFCFPFFICRKQTSIFRFSFAENKPKFAISISFVFRMYSIHIETAA